MQGKHTFGDDQGIGFEDRQHMHFVNAWNGEQIYRHPKDTPEWASSDRNIQIVVYAWLWRYVATCGLGHELRPGMSLGELEALAKRGQQILVARLAHVPGRMDAHLESTRNGIAGNITRLLYLAYRQRFRSTDIAEELNMTPLAVRIRLHRLNVLAKRLLLPDQLDEKRRARRAQLVSAYIGGKTMQQVADEFRITRRYLSKLLREFNICPRPNTRGLKQPTPPDVVEKIVRLHLEGKSAPRISREVGCHVNTIHAWIRARGLPRHRVGRPKRT